MFAKMMKGITGISFAGFCVLLVMYHRWDMQWCLTLAITAGTIFYHFLMRLLVGAMIGVCLNNQVDYRKRWFQMRPMEERIYKKLQVKKWKSKVPTYDPDAFSMEKHSLDEIVMAMCQSEIVHEVIVVLSFVPLLFSLEVGAFMVFLVTSVVAAAVDMVFVIVQRYNRPRVIRILEHKKR